MYNGSDGGFSTEEPEARICSSRGRDPTTFGSSGVIRKRFSGSSSCRGTKCENDIT